MGSAAARAPEVLGLHGVKTLDVHVLSCSKRQGMKTWVKLERALILVFREIHGEIPVCNRQGSGIKERDEFKHFTRARLKSIVKQFEG